MMTGTPASQSPADAYGLAKIVNPDGVPNFYTAWRDKVMNKVTCSSGRQSTTPLTKCTRGTATSDTLHQSAVP
jgi:hypothetical protein